MYRTIITLSAIAATLYGCAAPAPPYALSPGVPYANLRSSIQGAYGRYDSINIYVTKDGQPGVKKLFSIAKSVSTPAASVKVAANEPLNLMYSEGISGGRSCQLRIVVTLEPGKSYSLVGGFVYEKGPIPILTGTRQCQFGVIEDGTGMPVPYR